MVTGIVIVASTAGVVCVMCSKSNIGVVCMRCGMSVLQPPGHRKYVEWIACVPSFVWIRNESVIKPVPALIYHLIKLILAVFNFCWRLWCLVWASTNCDIVEAAYPIPFCASLGSLSEATFGGGTGMLHDGVGFGMWHIWLDPKCVWHR